MQYKMLINWRCGAYYIEGETYDLSKVTPAIEQKTIDAAVAAGYMIAVPATAAATPSTTAKK